MKRFISTSLALLAVLMTCAMPVLAAEGGHGGGGGRGGGWGHDGGWHGGGWHRGGWGYRGGWVWGLGWGPYYPLYDYPYYGYPYYPYYDQAPVIDLQPPIDLYVQPAPQQPSEPSYWYFCREANGYYPYVKQCPSGWMKVVPLPPSPPKQKE